MLHRTQQLLKYRMMKFEYLTFNLFGQSTSSSERKIVRIYVTYYMYCRISFREQKPKLPKLVT